MNNSLTTSHQLPHKFDSGRNARSQHVAGASDRELFHYLMQLEDYPHALPAIQQKIESTLSDLSKCENKSLAAFDSQTINMFFNELEQCLSSRPGNNSGPRGFPSWETFAHHGDASEPFGNGNLSKRQAAVGFRLISPTLLLQPGWLQNIGQANIGHRTESAYLFPIYARSVGNDTEAGINRHRIQLILEEQALSLPNLHSFSSIVQSGIPDWAFTPPVIYLSLSQCLRSYFPEILGFTLAHAYILREVLYPSLFTSIETLEASSSRFLKECHDANRENTINAIKSYLSERSVDQSWRRIKSGFNLYLYVHSNLITNVAVHLTRRQTLEQQVISIFLKKAPYAAGHHRALKLGSRSLDDWFQDEDFDGDGFLNELLKSGYFDHRSPRNSLFLRQLIAFDGPMFGVFTEHEVNIIIDWLEQLNSSETNLSEEFIENTTPAYLVRPLKTIEPVKRNYTSRELFYCLLNVDRHFEILPWAKKRVNKVLARANRIILFRAVGPLGQFPYSHQAFEKSIEQVYQKEIKKYRRFEPPPKLGKPVYKWGILQFAPMVLVDGSWLQHIARIETWDSPLHRKLFKIFADEIGNGSVHQNHPNVYRKLLKSLDIQLPRLDSREFAQHPDFLDAAFDVPVHLLAISHFPSAFLPEIIGLNLAIELSGLGAVYQRLVDELDYWGIDSQIVRLHISIDNLASGHSAIAKEVVMLYLDQISSQYGCNTMQGHWKRILAGYLSLKLVTRRMKFALLGGYCSRFLLPKLKF